MSLLDQVIANTNPSGPRIVSENHDLNSINWVAGMSDPGEMIGCGMYPELRRNAGEQDKEYQIRITSLLNNLPQEVREKIVSFGIKAALNRAKLDVTNGRVNRVSAGKLPWDGLGVHVSEALNAEMARQLSGITWLMDKVQSFYTNPKTGLLEENEGAFALIRMDNGKKLADVGPRYKPLQHKEGTDFLDDIIGEFGAKYEVAGSLDGGKKIFFVLNLKEQGFNVTAHDENKCYATFVNYNDGDGAIKVFASGIRAVCDNTVNQAIGKDGKSGLSIRHVGNLKAKIQAARDALRISVNKFSDFKDKAKAMVNTKVEPLSFFNLTLDDILDVTQADIQKGPELWSAVMKATTIEEKRKAREEFADEVKDRSIKFQDLVTRYHNERCGIDGQRGSLWSAVNAFTESIDHTNLWGRFKGSDIERKERRFDSLMGGKTDEVKQIVMGKASKLLSA